MTGRPVRISRMTRFRLIHQLLHDLELRHSHKEEHEHDDENRHTKATAMIQAMDTLVLEYLEDAAHCR